MSAPLDDTGWARHLPADVPVEGLDLLAQESLPRAWAAVFARTPQAPAVREWGEDTWTTYADLDRATRRVAARLARAGLRRGDRIIVSAGSSRRLVEAYVGALRLGLVVVPLNTAYTQREVDYVIDDVTPSGAIVDDETRAAWMARTGVVCGPDVDLPDGPEVEVDAVGRDDLALVAYTSGTTGAPKGAMLSHGNLLASSEAIRLAWRWTEADRLLLALPLFHIHGLGVALHGTLLAGASAVLLPKFDAATVVEAAAGDEMTMFFGVPTMYARLVDAPGVDALARLRLCVSGSAPLPADLHQRLADRAGQQILERYGMTETIMTVSNPYDGERRPGTVGHPLPGVELRIGLTEGDEEVLVRGPSVFRGYWQRPEATAESFTEDGWFHTGDLGEVSADGYVRIKGRSKELIISGGYNVYPAEVEAVLREHPAVGDVAVAGIPSAEWGETVGAWVILRPDAVGSAARPDELAEELTTHARGRLASYKTPRSINFVDDLPRNAMGKVTRAALVRPV
ncbi:AMP-binding protein [Nocardioides sp. DS6]|uniref:AMP-binding protein n=1 Tax=Nocardioides eburneus TaxID=3231482 RepID=A0ABV3T6S0_9ACTN